ncbi:hypothetical protein [Nostoc sp.]|uniref:hypothetical protein n=1 Tax=Nostoc sp. TaxID=1180 RepID=UPI002FEFE969
MSLVISHWSLVLSFDTTTALSASLRGNRAKSRFNYRVVVGVVTERSRTPPASYAQRLVEKCSVSKSCIGIHKGQMTND